jgi:hypothetical protein
MLELAGCSDCKQPVHCDSDLRSDLSSFNAFGWFSLRIAMQSDATFSAAPTKPICRWRKGMTLAILEQINFVY